MPTGPRAVSRQVAAQRGRLLEGPGGVRVMATLHPSAVLRLQDDADRAEAFSGLVGDLRLAWQQATTNPRS